MNAERFAAFANEIGNEGDNLGASIIAAVGALHVTDDRIGLAILAEFANRICHRQPQVCNGQSVVDRESAEQEAIAEMMREL